MFVMIIEKLLNILLQDKDT